MRELLSNLRTVSIPNSRKNRLQISRLKTLYVHLPFQTNVLLHNQGLTFLVYIFWLPFYYKIRESLLSFFGPPICLDFVLFTVRP